MQKSINIYVSHPSIHIMFWALSPFIPLPLLSLLFLNKIRYIYPNPPLNLKPPVCTTCIDLEARNVCMWYIVVVLGLAVVFGTHTL